MELMLVQTLLRYARFNGREKTHKFVSTPKKHVKKIGEP